MQCGTDIGKKHAKNIVLGLASSGNGWTRPRDSGEVKSEVIVGAPDREALAVSGKLLSYHEDELGLLQPQYG